MGQSLPLPDRIPVPYPRTKEKMEKDGITIISEDGERYVKYTLPDGWKMVNDSVREDLPSFYIADDKDMTRYCIDGA